MLDRDGPVDLASWEPDYGRLAEAQVRWERAHGRPLPRA
jgi:tRNA threonylcarbamoyladenosine biosynthesis protein TsaB